MLCARYLIGFIKFTTANSKFICCGSIFFGDAKVEAKKFFDHPEKVLNRFYVYQNCSIKFCLVFVPKMH